MTILSDDEIADLMNVVRRKIYGMPNYVNGWDKAFHAYRDTWHRIDSEWHATSLEDVQSVENFLTRIQGKFATGGGHYISTAWFENHADAVLYKLEFGTPCTR